MLLIQKPHIGPCSESVEFKVSVFQIVPICTYFFFSAQMKSTSQ